jgi:hypothetical protein
LPDSEGHVGGHPARRLSGRTDNTAPVLTLITQFGGGETHTLTTLYHLATNGCSAAEFRSVADLVREADVPSVPQAKVAVFVGNAWDPQPGRETPWIDLARQLAGETGVAALGSAARTTSPGTDAIARVFRAAGAPVLLLLDESEISEVVRRRLFQDLGPEKVRRNVARALGDWCFERRSQLPPEWMAVNSTATEAKAREHLQRRFEACYPFHPATLSIFQRKWQALPQYQQTRGTLAMLAQWISIAAQDAFRKARTEPLITLGSAPLSELGLRSVVIGQLGESRLVAAIETDVAGAQAHSRALDADTKGPLRDIHRRVGAAIPFESSGGQTDKVAHLPELRFALGEPELDTTTIDNAAVALEGRSYFVRGVGADGFRIGYQPTLKKVVSDRRASLHDETEVEPALRRLVEEEFRRGATIPVVSFPRESAEIPDSPRLTLVVADPELEWSGVGELRQQVADWTRNRGKSPRLHPGALVWCLMKPGRDLREKVERSLARKHVAREVAEGTLGSEFEKSDRAELQTKVREAEETAREEVWGDSRYAVIADNLETGGLKVFDLGAGHSSSGETLAGRVLTALRNEGFLNESVSAG